MTRRIAQQWVIIFLCPDCGSDLAPAHVDCGGEPVWRCVGCERRYIYGPAEWHQAPAGVGAREMRSASE